MAGGEHRSLGYAIQAGGGRRQAAIGEIGLIPVAVIVITRMPGYTVLLGKRLVRRTDARAFDATQLLDAAPLWRLFAKAAPVHLAHNLEPCIVVKGKACLVQQPIGTCTSRLAGRIEAYAGLAHPYQQGADLRRQFACGVRHAHARLEHQASNAPHWNVRTHAGGVDSYEGAIQHIKLTTLDIQYRQALLDRNGFERWKHGSAADRC